MARVDEIGAQAHPTKWRFMGRDGEITSHLIAVFWQAGGVANGFIRGTSMAGFIIGGGNVPCPLEIQPSTLRHRSGNTIDTETKKKHFQCVI